jgi:hypothetical protein
METLGTVGSAEGKFRKIPFPATLTVIDGRFAVCMRISGRAPGRPKQIKR